EKICNYSIEIECAKANAAECEDQEEALGLAIITCPSDAVLLRKETVVGVKDGIYRLPSGWDYRVEVWHKDSKYFLPKYVAKLYRTDEQIKLDRLGNTSSPVIQTEESHLWEKAHEYANELYPLA